MVQQQQSDATSDDVDDGCTAGDPAIPRRYGFAGPTGARSEQIQHVPVFAHGERHKSVCRLVDDLLQDSCCQSQHRGLKKPKWPRIYLFL